MGSIRKAVLKQLKCIIAIPAVYKEHIDSAIYDMLCNTVTELGETSLPTLKSLCLDELLRVANTVPQQSLPETIVESNLYEIKQLIEGFHSRL